MADVTINATLQATGAYTNSGPQFTVWTTSSIGYTFFINSGKKIQYSKTTNGGSSWAAAVSVLDTSETTNGYITFAIWFDKWTSGDSGTLIHVVGNDYNSDIFRWRSLDTASDTLGTTRDIVTIVGGQVNTADFIQAGFVTVTKSRGGNLYASLNNNAGARIYNYKSTNSGTSWSSIANPFEAQDDLYQFIPANDTDNNDIACIYFDDSADELSFKLYDDSANTWGNETSIATGIDSGADWPDDQFMFHAAIRHSDGKAIVAFWNDEDVNTADLKCSVLTLTAAGKNATALTDVISNVTEGGGSTSVLIDQNTDTLYVGYLKGGTWESLVDVYWKSSTNAGSSWGTETKYNTTQDDYRNLSMGTSIAKYSSGRLYAAFTDDDDDDSLGNFDLSVSIAALTPFAGTQAAYRIYADGTENGSSALAAQDTEYDADISGGDVNLALRVRVQNTGSEAGLSTDDYSLQYELNDSGSFLNVGAGGTLIDSYAVANADNADTFNLTRTGEGQAFIGTGVPLTSVRFYLRTAAGAPSGNMTAELYAVTGTYGNNALPTGGALVTSNPFNVAALSGSFAPIDFVFSSPYTPANGTEYFIAVMWSGGSGSNTIEIQIDNSAGGHAGNYGGLVTGSWSGSTTRDVIFYLYTAPPVAAHNSSNLTDSGATTNRLGSGSGSFVAGEISEDGLVDDLQITGSNYTELLYSLTLESDALADNDTLDFRVLRNGAVLGTYTVTPRITITEGGGAPALRRYTLTTLGVG